MAKFNHFTLITMVILIVNVAAIKEDDPMDISGRKWLRNKNLLDNTDDDGEKCEDYALCNPKATTQDCPQNLFTGEDYVNCECLPTQMCGQKGST